MNNPIYSLADMKKCVARGSEKMSKKLSMNEKRIHEIRRRIEVLDTRVLNEHRTIQSIMKDLSGLWDLPVELESSTRGENH